MELSWFYFVFSVRTLICITCSLGKIRQCNCNDNSEYSTQKQLFFMPPLPRPAGGIERSGCPYVRTYVRPSVDQVKIFVQGRISWDQQEYTSHDLMTVHLLRTLARLSRLRFLSKVESQDLLMVANWYFILRCISMRPAGIYKSHGLLTYISWSTDFMASLSRLRFLSKVESQNQLMVAGWYFIWGCISTRPAGIYKIPDLYFMICLLRTGRFPWLIFLSLVDSWALLMVASWYLLEALTLVRPAASAFMPWVHARGWR